MEKGDSSPALPTPAGAGGVSRQSTSTSIKPPEKTSIDALAVVIRTNTTLLSLDVSGNSMSEKQLRAVSSAVKRNTTLTSLNGVGKSSLYYHNLRGRNTRILTSKARASAQRTLRL